MSDKEACVVSWLSKALQKRKSEVLEVEGSEMKDSMLSKDERRNFWGREAFETIQRNAQSIQYQPNSAIAGSSCSC
jgi:hypothetical protein